MTTEAEVDLLLASWDERLKRVDDNLIALESEPTYELLSGVRGAQTALEGMTRERVMPALSALSELYEHRARLGEVVTRAKGLRASLSFWDKDPKLLEVKELLEGASITMTGTPKPLAERSLLDPSGNDVAIAPERLLEWMSHAYLAARDVVTAVSLAWRRLEPVVEGAEGELRTLEKTAAELGLSGEVLPELKWLKEELGRVRVRVSKDPLGVSSGIDSGLTPRLSELRHRLHDLEAKKARVTAGLREAEISLQQGRELHHAAHDALVRLNKEIVHADVLAASDEASLLGLAPWRDKLEETARAGRFGPADVGLSRWHDTARAYASQDRAVLAKVESLLRERTELFGRLSARRAQLAAILASGAAVPAGLVERGLAVEALLRERPTRLAHAAAVMKQYEAEVVALAARSRRG